MSIVVPVYQEDPVIFAAAIESWLRNRVHEVILVIDASDARGARRSRPATRSRCSITDVPGKRDALRKGWNAASTDAGGARRLRHDLGRTTWRPRCASRSPTPASAASVRGRACTGRTGFLARITDMFLDHRYFDENASQSLLGKAVSCLSGRTAVYRRALLMDIEDEFMHETFWGVPVPVG